MGQDRLFGSLKGQRWNTALVPAGIPLLSLLRTSDLKSTISESVRILLIDGLVITVPNAPVVLPRSRLASKSRGTCPILQLLVVHPSESGQIGTTPA